ncbi:NHL repeat-containing protein [Mucilaginibacter angelicae]|uniref:NHL repeat-containing protein n=1 Tax=Mucilaginibacter angelicae TaxID=869718 RepID=A0ABV6LAG2_9SPHI
MKKSFTKTILFTAFIIAVALAGAGCGKKGDATPVTFPDLTTMDVVTAESGTVAYTGGLFNTTTDVSLSSYGICYSSTNQTPTTADKKTTDTVIQFAYTTKLTGLSPKTTYYARAYGVNSAGTGYGKVVQFTTSDGTTSAGGTVSTLAGNTASDFVDGLGGAALFDSPQGITVGADGNIYVADSFNSAIRKVTTAGDVTTLSGNGAIGYVDGPIATAQFYAPQSLVTDASNNIYVADYGNNIIRKITPAGIVSTFAGSGDAGYTDGTGTKATFNSPRGLAIDGSGNIFVADMGNNLIRKITPAGVVTTFAGSRGASYLDNATATSATFNKPNGIAIDANNNIYVAETLNHAIRKITPAGVVTTFTGGNKQTGLVGSPSAIAFDKSGNLFVADQSGRILEITKDKVLKSIAGNSTSGFAEGVGTAGIFNSPQGIAVDAGNNVYVADYYNNRIRKIVLP